MSKRLEGEYPDHPILSQAWKHEIVALRLELQPLDDSEPYLDLTLSLEGARRVLRFWSPGSVTIDDGPRMNGGLEILDIRSRGWDGLGVAVGNFEGSTGGVRFYARAVEDMGGPAS